MTKITKDMIIADVLAANPGTAAFFLDIGMHCLGCPSAAGETVEEACGVHGADPDLLLEKINKFIEESNG